MAGLNGFFGKLWGAAKRVAKIALDNSGIIGGIIDGILQEFFGSGWQNRGGGGNSPYAENEVERWSDQYFIPFYSMIAPWIMQPNVTSSSYISQFNDVMEKLCAWRAYFEFVALKSSDEDEQEIASLKAEYLFGHIYSITEAWSRTANIKGLSIYPYSFDPTQIKKIGNENLDWAGAKSIKAEKLIIADKPDPTTGGGGTQTGGGNTGGGGTQTGEGNTGGGNTGGGTQTGGGNTGGTKPPTVPTKPPKTPKPNIPNPNNPWNYLPEGKPKKNHTLTVVALALGAAFLIRRTR